VSKRASILGDNALEGSFGFDPRESAAHFLVHIPTAGQQPVEISEHLSWDEKRVSVSAHYGIDRQDGQVRARLARTKWNEIADVVRAELNSRLKSQGKRPGKWKLGYNPVERTLGKELTLLIWGIEDADPSLIRTAIANWQGLAPEERWWLYTMTSAATGHCQTGRGVGWRKAVRYALTENPVTNRVQDQPVVPEFFRLAAAQSGTIFESVNSEANHMEAAHEEPQTTRFPDSLVPGLNVQGRPVVTTAKRPRSSRKAKKTTL
jgi:hypothetical protein